MIGMQDQETKVQFEPSSPERVAEAPVLRPVMPELDSIRGIAVLAVLFYHGLFWSVGVEHATGFTRFLLLATKPGWLGVELFFVLSGFLITGILLDSKSHPAYYRRFYIRRALRILPAYLAVVLGLFCTGIIDLPFFLLSTLFLANVTPLFGIAMQYGPLWSLAVEEHYYLIWPAIVKRVSPRTLALIALAITILGPVLRLVSFHLDLVDGLYTYSWFTLDGLAMGTLLALFLRHPGVGRRAVTILAMTLTAVALCLLTIGLPFGILHRTTPLGAAMQYTPWCLLFTGLLAACLLIGSSRFAPFVQSRVLRFFGHISFGLYLMHVAIFWLYDFLAARFWAGLSLSNSEDLLGLMLLRFLAAGGAAILLAALSRRHYEQRFLDMKEMWGR